MRLRHIEIFHAVYVTGSVSGAARALNVSQPTVSKVLRHAESQLGFELFHREKGRISPTEKGELLFEQTLPVFEQINELRKYASMLSSTRIGQLRLAMTPAFSLEVVPKVLTEFAKLHPDVSIEVETLHAFQISKAILSNSVDLGLVYEAVETPGLKVEPMGKTRFVCVSSESIIFSNTTISITDLQDQPLIELNSKSPLGQMLKNKLYEAWGKRPESQFLAETYHLAKRLAAQGAGVAIIDNITAQSGQTDGLNVFEIDDLPNIRIDLVSRNNEPLSGYKADFSRLLRKAISKF